MMQKHRVRVCFLLWLGAILLHTPSCGFGQTKQPPLSEVRERTGLAIRKKVGQRGGGPALDREERNLVRKISMAGERRNWQGARSLFGTYRGNAPQIYTAAMHAAFRCRKYSDGANIYEQCQTNCKTIDQPVLVIAMRIFAKLGKTTKVKKIWNEALDAFGLDDFLASARIVAAADVGDVETAAEILHEMNRSNVSINVYNINSAIRACKGQGERQHEAAKYFFDLLHEFQLSPTIVTFTSLIAAYKTADLHCILSTYNEMKDMHIEPDAVFAETYIFTLLQYDDSRRRVEENLHDLPVERLQAARDALDDFEGAGLSLHKSCVSVDRELTRMGL